MLTFLAFFVRFLSFVQKFTFYAFFEFAIYVFCNPESNSTQFLGINGKPTNSKDLSKRAERTWQGASLQLPLPCPRKQYQYYFVVPVLVPLYLNMANRLDLKIHELKILASLFVSINNINNINELTVT